jgi:hypothetical protein
MSTSRSASTAWRLRAYRSRSSYRDSGRSVDGRTLPRSVPTPARPALPPGRLRYFFLAARQRVGEWAGTVSSGSRRCSTAGGRRCGCRPPRAPPVTASTRRSAPVEEGMRVAFGMDHRRQHCNVLDVVDDVPAIGACLGGHEPISGHLDMTCHRPECEVPRLSPHPRPAGVHSNLDASREPLSSAPPSEVRGGTTSCAQPGSALHTLLARTHYAR